MTAADLDSDTSTPVRGAVCETRMPFGLVAGRRLRALLASSAIGESPEVLADSAEKAAAGPIPLAAAPSDRCMAAQGAVGVEPCR